MYFLANFDKDMPKRKYDFYVYIMASPTGTLYTGITDNLPRRVAEHKERKVKGFTQRYACEKLVYAENYKYIDAAIAREKEIKLMMRYKKEELIKIINPQWKDLSDYF